ncbi:MAG: zinc finger-like domain-containing protein [Phycisphaerae bacterium]
MKSPYANMIAVVVSALAAGVPAGQAAAAPALPDALEIHKATTPRVCLVEAEGALGVPEAYATGFLLGSGKFVITDLASLARPGVEKVTIRFKEGEPLESDQFGMADPATGLVAIALPESKKTLGGLSLSTAVGAGGDGLPVVVVGWRHAADVDLATGRIAEEVPATALAEACGIKAPSADLAFARLYAPAKGIAVGAPVVDAGGGVVGTMMHVAGFDGLLTVPARALRGALLAAQAKLRPLTQLPAPVWPIVVQTLPGEPITPQQFAGAVRAVKLRSRCDTCRGDGEVTVKKVVGTRRVGGMVRPIIRQVPKRCDKCGGDGIICEDGLYAFYARTAEGATRLAADPATSTSVMEAVVENTTSLLDALRRVGDPYRSRLAEQASKDLGKGKGPFPHGMVVYAQRLETVTHAGREYTFLRVYRSGVRLAVAAADLERAVGAASGRGRSPGVGDWIVLIGLARAPVDLANHKPVYVSAFGWGWGPNLGPPPAYLQKSHPPSRRPSEPPPSKRDDGKPDFFGL